MASVESKSGTPPKEHEKLIDSGSLAEEAPNAANPKITMVKCSEELDIEINDSKGAKEGVKEPEPVPSNISPFHARLLNAKQSPLLTPLHFEVRNLSYWYHQRHKLGPKKHAAMITRQNPHNFRWESYIYKMAPREEDGEIVPTRTLCASHKTKWAAFKNCEKCCRERDANPAEVKNKEGHFPKVIPSTILETHFHIVVVSPKFDRLSQHERLEVVYEAILQECGQQLQGTLPTINHAWTENDESKLQSNRWDPWTREGNHPFKKNDRNYFRKSKCGPRINAAGLGLCAPTRGKYGSLYGQNMCNYEVFRILLPSQPLSLVIECKTPSQWKPDVYIAPNSERLGRDHLNHSNVHIPKEVKPKKQTERMKLLATVIDEKWKMKAEAERVAAAASPTKGVASTKSSKSVTSLLDSLGMDSAISGVIDKKKVGGIYGHFFRDLPHDIKEKLSKNSGKTRA